MIKCPECGMLNPEDTIKCKCGITFSSYTDTESSMNKVFILNKGMYNKDAKIPMVTQLRFLFRVMLILLPVIFIVSFFFSMIISFILLPILGLIGLISIISKLKRHKNRRTR